MTRLGLLIALSFTVACGSSKPSGAVDAGPGSAGFDKPTMVVHANTQGSDGSWTDDGPADLSCLGTPSSDMPTTVAVTLATTVRDFQTQATVGGATVTAFAGINYTAPFDMQTADGSGDVTVTVPTGTDRFGFQMTYAATQYPTFLLNQQVDPSMATQTLAEIQSVSASTAETLPALIGETRTLGTGVVAGTFRDCQVRPISNFVVTVSSTSMTATPVTGGQAYYFSPIASPLPVRHTVEDMASGNGLFMAIQLPVTSTAYVQAWGYTADSAVGGDMTLLSELAAPIIGDNVVTGSFEPIRQ
jgi:hypothetical protein